MVDGEAGTALGALSSGCAERVQGVCGVCAFPALARALSILGVHSWRFARSGRLSSPRWARGAVDAELRVGSAPCARLLCLAAAGDCSHSGRVRDLGSGGCCALCAGV